jgi:hypothetical protein
MARITKLTRELSMLLAQESPRPAVKFLSAADLPGWVAEGLREAIRRKIAEESPIGFRPMKRSQEFRDRIMCHAYL